MVIEGVDYSFARPSPSGLAAAGKKFAVRYGGPGSTSKMLTESELTALRTVGIDVVANAEGTAGGYTGAAAGRSWAQSAQADFRALGMPADRPIYFSVDFDAGTADWPGIDAALRASAAVLGANHVGVYGSYDVIEHCRATGLATWFWQTYAWSSGRGPASYTHLYQYRNGVTIGGGDCDLTRALLADYGQWGYQKETEMAISWADDIVANPRQRADAATNKTTSVSWALGDMYAQIYNLRDSVAAMNTSLSAAVKALAAKDAVDEKALAAELVPGVVAGVLAALPTDADDVTVEELTAAIRALIIPAA